MWQGVFSHRVMLADKVRMNAYKKAIFSVVRKNDTVCDIGSGSGILAFFSALAGARKVYAIEKNDIIKEAKRLAEHNNLADRIVFINDISFKVKLPEKADVVVSELIGGFGLDENLGRVIIDARKRFLKKGGRLIPNWLQLYLAPVESKSIWQERIGFWKKDFYGLDFSLAQDFAISQRYAIDCIRETSFLARPAELCHFDFYKIQDLRQILTKEFSIAGDGKICGWVGYFKVGLSRAVTFSTTPGLPSTHWKQAFFPLKERVSVRKGDRVIFKAQLLPLETNTFWQWETSISRNNSILAGFKQNNFYIRWYKQ